MKTARLFCSALLCSGVLAGADDAPPALNVRQAVALAEKALADKGATNQVFIQSIGLIRSSLSGARNRWQVVWSSPVEGSKPGSKEVGLEINMAGEVVHLIKGKGEYQKFAAPH